MIPKIGAVAFALILTGAACMEIGGPDAQVPILPVTPSNPTTPPTQQPPNVPIGTPPPFPTVANASAVYQGPENLYDPYIWYHGSRLHSRYVFFSDSTFLLQYASYRFGIFQYPGRFSRTNSNIVFFWQGASTAGPWGSVATVRGDTLDVRYGDLMIHSDFVDGRYVLVR
jgi:hypothetical protein